MSEYGDQATADPEAEVDETSNGEVDTSAAISRGKGKSLDAIQAMEGPEGDAARAAVQAFRDLVSRHQAAEAAAEELKEERNQAVRSLKDDHDVGFTAQAEIIGATSSLVLYLYERAAGKTAKQIRAESQASAAAKAALREGKPASAARKQTPEEKAFRKAQRDQLKAFLEEQRRLAAERGDSTDEVDAGLAEVDAEETEDTIDDE